MDAQFICVLYPPFEISLRLTVTVKQRRIKPLSCCSWLKTNSLGVSIALAHYNYYNHAVFNIKACYITLEVKKQSVMVFLNQHGKTFNSFDNTHIAKKYSNEISKKIRKVSEKVSKFIFS